VLSEMAKYGLLLDLAHSFAKTFDDAPSAWSGPVICDSCSRDRSFADADNLCCLAVKRLIQN
jgi:hypothetical protein